jgi:phage FluMu protein Com
MQDVKCKNCNKTLAKVIILVGAIRCRSCKFIFEYRVYEEMTTSNYTKDFTNKNRYDIKGTEPQEFTGRKP